MSFYDLASFIQEDTKVIAPERDYVEIPLSNSEQKAIVDREDLPKVLKHPWFLKKDNRTQTWYVATSVRVGDTVKTIRLHVLVMEAPPGMDVHHKNRNPLDNRKDNLVLIPAREHRGHPKSSVGLANEAGGEAGGAGTTMSDISYLPTQVGVVRAALDDLRKKRKKWKLEVLEGEKEYTVSIEDQLRITVPMEHWDSFQGMVKDALVEEGYLDLSFQEDLVRSILEKYKRVETDKKIVLDSGSEVTPVATLADEFGGRAQVTVDDGCYVLNLLQENGTYKYTAWIFPEAHDVLKDLGNPAEEHLDRLRIETKEQFPVEESVLQDRKEELIQLITEKFQKPPISVALNILKKWNNLFEFQKELTSESIVSLCNEKAANVLLENLLKGKAEDLGQIDILIQDLSEKPLCQVLSDIHLGCRLQGNYKCVEMILECHCVPGLAFSLVVGNEGVAERLSESKLSLFRIENVFYPRVGQLAIEDGVLESLKNILDKEVVNEDVSGIKALYSVYHGLERGLDPEKTDLFTALSMMKDYYKEYLRWYDKVIKRRDFKRYSEELPVVIAYQRRLQEVSRALESRNEKEMLVALDMAIGQWHIDYPAIHHIGAEIGDDLQLENLLVKIEEILFKLGKLPKESPYVRNA
jgi:hypothetical protein